MKRSSPRKMPKYGILFFTIAFTLAACIWGMHVFLKEEEKNLARRKGVKATCDSVEAEGLSADKAIDGNDVDLSSRWSSENNWENASHYIELEFPEEISVSFVVLKWERTNVTSYQLEGSLNGAEWEVLADFEQAPEEKRQEIALPEHVNVRFLRLSTRAVSQREEDYSNLYQNVSLYEFEVYEDKPAAYLLEAPKIAENGNNGRYLKMPEAPEGYEVSYLGADYEQIIGADGTVYETIQEKEVTVGFLVEPLNGEGESREVSFTVTVPPVADRLQGGNTAPEVIPAIAEWDGGEGFFVPGKDSRVIVQEDPARESLRKSAELFVRQYQAMTGYGMPIVEGTMEEARAGDFYLGYATEALDMAERADEVGESEAVGTADGEVDTDEAGMTDGEVDTDEADMEDGEVDADEAGTADGEVDTDEADMTDGIGDDIDAVMRLADGIGEEGYVCDIDDKCVIIGTDRQGVYWGTVTVLHMLRHQSGIPQGRIRDYPKYPVRGFGIDVARKAVSMEMLYQIMTNMSWYKMNDLSIHLNDNVILSTSGLTGSVEEAMTGDSAFRLDIDIVNEKGERLASDEYAYTPEEFAQFIETAKAYGISVVPEIDTPAHSLAITKLFPEYALTVRNEAVDQIDLGKKEAVDTVKAIWSEAIESGAFAGVSALNVGMDEYYGDGETYRRYVEEMISFVKEKSGAKNIRIWGSLSNMEGTSMPGTDGVQMNIWSTIWAKPLDMYHAGYSLINMQNNHLYIIPGGGYDYLDTRELLEHWEPNKFYDYNQLEKIPSYSPQMLGAAYMIWNDMCGNLDVGISESDLFVRFYEPLGVISGKLWGEIGASYEEWTALFDEIGAMPESSLYGVRLCQGEELHLIAEGEVVSLSGGADYVENEIDKSVIYMGNEFDRNVISGKKNDVYDMNVNSFDGIGGAYEVSMQLYREGAFPEGSDEAERIDATQGTVRTERTATTQGTVRTERTVTIEGNEGIDGTNASPTQEEILFEADSAYGQTAFKAVQTGTGQVGFSREGRDYSFDYTLPVGEWVKLTVRGEQNQTSLYVNGELVDTLGDGEPFTEYATFVFPLERTGSKTHSFRGMIKDVTVRCGIAEE